MPPRSPCQLRVPTDAALSPASPGSLGTAQSRALVLGSPRGHICLSALGTHRVAPGKTRLLGTSAAGNFRCGPQTYQEFALQVNFLIGHLRFSPDPECGWYSRGWGFRPAACRERAFAELC